MKYEIMGSISSSGMKKRRHKHQVRKRPHRKKFNRPIPKSQQIEFKQFAYEFNIL